MVVFKGHPLMKRVGKQVIKKHDDTKNTKDQKDEDYKRYI